MKVGLTNFARKSLLLRTYASSYHASMNSGES